MNDKKTGGRLFSTRRRIVWSVLSIAVAGAVGIGATIALFSDTEVSTGNTFTAGQIDLKVDSQCHYYHLTGYDNDGPVYSDVGCPDGVGNWEQEDITGLDYRFFDFGDVKPGDKGENTISLHVVDNDAWGSFSIGNIVQADNSCNAPEITAEPDCVTDLSQGELDENLNISIWLDQGAVAGFQNDGDESEGDNIRQEDNEPLIWEGKLSEKHVWYFSDVLAQAYVDDSCTSPDGHNDYGPCHGLAEDGRMVASAVYYFGLSWSVPQAVGNEIQSDSLSADLTFDVVQHRNNPLKMGLPEEGLVAWYKFEDDPMGETAADSSEFGHDATINGGVSSTSGKVGQAFSFDGTSGYLNVPYAETLDPYYFDAISYEFWIDPEGTNIREMIINQPRAIGSNGQQIHLNSGTSITAWIEAEPYTERRHTINLPSTDWLHVVISYDGATQLKFYFNGEHAITRTVANMDNFFAGDTDGDCAVIGAFRNPPPSYNKYFEGYLDELKIYDRALDADEVLAHYQASL